MPLCAGPSGGEGRVLRSATRSVLSGRSDPGLVTALLSSVSTTCRMAQPCSRDPRWSKETGSQVTNAQVANTHLKGENEEPEGPTGGSGLGTRDWVTDLDWKPGPSPAGCTTLGNHPNSLKFQFPSVPKNEKGMIPPPPLPPLTPPTTSHPPFPQPRGVLRLNLSGRW